jgi:hypothetical protein
MDSWSLPISALPEVREVIDGAERILKADISRIKRVLADPAATLAPSIVERTLQEAKDALNCWPFIRGSSRAGRRTRSATPSA